MAAAPADPAPFGVYLIVPLSHHGRTVGSAGFYGPPDRTGRSRSATGFEAEWGRGYGTEAVAGLVRICANTAG